MRYRWVLLPTAPSRPQIRQEPRHRKQQQDPTTVAPPGSMSFHSSNRPFQRRGASALDDPVRASRLHGLRQVVTSHRGFDSRVASYIIPFLKPGVTFEELDAVAHAVTSLEADQEVQRARKALFRRIANALHPAA